jgi:hypothetical protein
MTTIEEPLMEKEPLEKEPSAPTKSNKEHRVTLPILLFIPFISLFRDINACVAWWHILIYTCSRALHQCLCWYYVNDFERSLNNLCKSYRFAIYSMMLNSMGNIRQYCPTMLGWYYNHIDWVLSVYCTQTASMLLVNVNGMSHPGHSPIASGTTLLQNPI